MFSDLFSILGDADGAEELDSTFGAGTWEKMECIRSAYREYLIVRSKESWLDAESKEYLLNQIAAAPDASPAAGAAP